MTTFTEKVEELLDKIGDICHEQYLGCEQVDGQYYYSYKNEVVNMLDNQEVRQLIIKAHQAEISRVLELWEDDIERGFIPKCSYCATKRKVVGQTVKGKDAQKNNNLPRNWGYYCQKCYDEGSELEREAMYG